MKIKWYENAWDEYQNWQFEDKKTLKKINSIIKDIQRNKNDGIGKPESLKNDKKGYWSRRIDDKNRLVYTIENDTIIIIECKGHYTDR